MQATDLLPVLLTLCLTACSPTGDPGPMRPPVAALTPAQKIAIGQKIWKNECGGTVDGLTSWNEGEEFPSLGIGHFIWYPKGFNGPFKESWPEFVAYAQAQRVPLPAIATRPHAPWPNKAAFEKAFRGSDLQALRRWLVTHITLQTDFIIRRSQAALPKVLEAAPASERRRIAENYRKVATTPHGVYALIDYVNFKGDGTHKSERYQGQGWGLMQVLGNMRSAQEGPAAAAEFAASATRMLERRIANAPPERQEGRWMKGWRNRCLSYARPLN